MLTCTSLPRCAGHAVGLNNVYMEKGIDTGHELLARLQRVPGLLAPVGRPPLRCIVIDSIGHIFRHDTVSASGGLLAGMSQSTPQILQDQQHPS